MQNLTQLGNPRAQPKEKLEWFELAPGSEPMRVTCNCSEFTCRCPVTQQPDWAKIVIKYTPKVRIIESKSLKLYLETFRERGIFHEHLAQVILHRVIVDIRPSFCKVTVKFNTRGGVAISAEATYRE